MRATGILFTASVLVLVLSIPGTDMTMFGPRNHYFTCPNHKSFDMVWPDYERYTCKTVDGGDYPICEDIYFKLGQSLLCPNHGYFTGWKVYGKSCRYRCCHQRGLTYTHNNCRTHVNDALIRGGVYRVLKGSVVVGSQTHNGGKTWINYVCDYNASPQYGISYLTKMSNKYY